MDPDRYSIFLFNQLESRIWGREEGIKNKRMKMVVYDRGRYEKEI